MVSHDAAWQEKIARESLREQVLVPLDEATSRLRTALSAALSCVDATMIVSLASAIQQSEQCRTSLITGLWWLPDDEWDLPDPEEDA